MNGLQLVETFDKILKFWKSIKDVPEDFDAVKRDVELLKSITNKISGSKCVLTSSAIANALYQCQSRVDELLAIVQSFDKGLTDDSKRQRKWTACKAHVKKSYIEKITQYLRDMKIDLQLALDGEMLFEIERITVQVDNLSSRLQDTQLVRKPVSGDQKLLLPHGGSNIKGVLSDVNKKSTMLVDCLRDLDSGPPPLSENGDPGSTGIYFRGEFDSLHDAFRRRCCPPRSFRYNGSSSFEELIGEISLQYSNIPVLSQQEPCHGRFASTFRATYRFPPWLLAWRLGLVATARSLNGLQVSLKTARVRDFREEIFFMAYDGNVSEINRYFHMGLASPHDVTNTTNTSLLHFAMSNEHIEFARLLIHHGADMYCESKTKMSPLAIGWEKILSESSRTPKPLLALLRDVDENECLVEQQLSEIHLAVLGLSTMNLDDAVKGSFANINQPDADGRTALAWAALRKDFRKVRKLLSEGASPNLAARDGCIPLHMAAQAGSPSCVNILILRGSNIQHKNACGNTALHEACKQKRPEDCAGQYLRCVEKLLESGSEIDAEDITGKTALRFCVESSNMDCALLLLERGANIHSRTKDGKSLLLAALVYSRTEMLKLLIGKGALPEKGLGDDAATLQAVAKSNNETREVLRKSMDPAIYHPLLIKAQMKGK